MKSRLYHCCSVLLVFISLSLLSGLTRAEDGGPRANNEQRMVLKLSWLDEDGKVVDKRFSLSDMDLMPQTSVTMVLPESVGVVGEHAWSGVPLGSLVALSERGTDSLKVSALNGYSVSVPMSDIKRFNPTLVFRRDGELISVREKGPFLLIYPFNKFSELNQQIYLNRLVWQVNEITLQ